MFVGDLFDKTRFLKDTATPSPRRSYVILFTPRSGSSWLCDVLQQTNALGNPGEFLNPNFIPDIASFLNAPDAVNYLRLVARHHASPTGIFGIEATHSHLNRMFSHPAGLRILMPQPVDWFFLIREDIVAQAVSLHLAIETGVFHAADHSDDDVRGAREAARYSAGPIARRIQFLLHEERKAGDLFYSLGVDPFRISYEWLMSMGPEGTIRHFARCLDEPVPASIPQPRHRRLSTDASSDFAARFRREQADFVAWVDCQRSGVLSDLARHRDEAARIPTLSDRITIAARRFIARQQKTGLNGWH